MRYQATVVAVYNSCVAVDLELTRVAPGRSPVLRAEIWFDKTVAPEQAFYAAPTDRIEVVLIEVDRYPIEEQLFVSLPAEPEWLTWNNETVRQLARHIRTTREFGLLPVLADALEEAGCTDVALLEHCRQPLDGRHSWAVELLATQQ